MREFLKMARLVQTASMGALIAVLMQGCPALSGADCPDASAPLSVVRIDARSGGFARDIQRTADGGFIIAGVAARQAGTGGEKGFHEKVLSNAG